MKQVIVDTELREIEVHPPHIYKEWLQHVLGSSQQLLRQEPLFQKKDCPGCASIQHREAFACNGYTYRVCQPCSSLFVSPRPTREQIHWYLYDSELADFRCSSDYLEAMHSHWNNLSRGRVEWILRMSRQLGLSHGSGIIEVEGRSGFSHQELNNGLFASDFRSVDRTDQERILSLEQLSGLAKGGASLLCAFNVIEHSWDPTSFIQAVNRVLQVGGLLALTTRSASGLDILALWENASILPIEHLNLLTVEGLRSLLESTGFEIVEMSSPGQLDLQLIEKVRKENPSVQIPRFLEYFLEKRNPYYTKRFQSFLQESLLSSHVRVAARKSENVTD